jgi:hypothetical protein
MPVNGKLPRKPHFVLRVQGADYRVYLFGPRKMKALGYPKATGVTDIHNRVILLLKTMDIKKSLFHEIVEIAVYETEVEKTSTHAQIRGLENLMYQVISDNKLVFHE